MGRRGTKDEKEFDDVKDEGNTSNEIFLIYMMSTFGMPKDLKKLKEIFYREEESRNPYQT